MSKHKHIIDWKAQTIDDVPFKMLHEIPENYVERVGAATTQPVGFVWFTNGMSISSKYYKRVLVCVRPEWVEE